MPRPRKPRPKPDPTDIRRFSFFSLNANRKDRPDVQPGTRVEIYEAANEEEARERFAAEYEFTGTPTIKEIGF